MPKTAQSLSICVPGKKCANNCRFCVSQMHETGADNAFTGINPDYMECVRGYKTRMAYALSHGVDTIILTGEVEPLQNFDFLKQFALILREFNAENHGGFTKIEVQSSGFGITNEMLAFLKRSIGVTTISLSLASLDSEDNAIIEQQPGGSVINIAETCKMICDAGINLRLSLNMSQRMVWSYDDSPAHLFNKVNKLGARQLTIRKLYWNGDSAQSEWVKKYADIPYVAEAIRKITEFARENGIMKEHMAYGYERRIVNGVSIVIDNDSMNEGAAEKEASKYFVLRPDCHLYDGWNAEDFVF